MSSNKIISKKQTNKTPGDENYQSYFQELFNQIEADEENIVQLNNLKQKAMNVTNTYAKEDFEKIDSYIAVRTKSLKLLKDQYQSKSDLYMKVLVDLKSKIDTRKNLMQEFGTTFDANPELKQFFIQKQAVLDQVYKDASKSVFA